MQLPQSIGSKTFAHSDQVAFATFSDDQNPIHMDKITARRLASGAQVVHGVNILLSALEILTAKGLLTGRISSLRCDFKTPVNLGEEVVFSLRELTAESATITARLPTAVCTQIVISFAQQPDYEVSRDAETREVVSVGSTSTPRAMSEARYQGFAGHLEWAADKVALASEFYPSFTRQYGAGTCYALAMLSHIVGMVCPGLNSLFVSLDVAFVANSHVVSGTGFQVTKFDDRVKLVEICVDQGPVVGKIQAFQRPALVRQLDFATITQSVSPGEFSALDAYVIGGSRGLGELVGKIIAAGGGRCTLGYALGKDDALAVCEEINSARPGACAVDWLDISALSVEKDGQRLAKHNAIFYFATPSINKKANTSLDPTVLEKFLEYYVHAFFNLCLALEHASTHRVDVFFPSTIYVVDRPRGMTEYAMAKAAAEIMISDLSKTLRNVRVHVTRLPRLKSDQTNSFLPVKTEDNLTYMLKVVREIAVS